MPKKSEEAKGMVDKVIAAKPETKSKFIDLPGCKIEICNGMSKAIKK